MKKEQPKILCTIKSHDLVLMADFLSWVIDWGKRNGRAELYSTHTEDGFVEIHPVIVKPKRIRRKKVVESLIN